MRDTTNWKKEEKDCKGCNKTFISFVWRKQKYCSHICALKVPRWNKGKKVPEMGGQNHYAWIKDRTQLVKNESKHLDSVYREWMKTVKNRDEWKCKISNSDCDGRLEAHHILNWVDYPELRYQVNNGITLCHAHHPRGRAKEKRLAPMFRELVSVSR